MGMGMGMGNRGYVVVVRSSGTQWYVEDGRRVIGTVGSHLRD